MNAGAPLAPPPTENCGPEARHHCPLCGYRFDRSAEHCGGCPMKQGCGATSCPRCGYEFVDRSATIDALRRIGRRVARWLAREGDEVRP